MEGQQEVPRHFSNPSVRDAQATPVPYNELIACLERIIDFNPPSSSTTWTFEGLYRGPTSIAFLFHRLSTLYPGLILKSQLLAHWALYYLRLSDPRHGGHSYTAPTANNCGIRNETLAHLTAKALIQWDHRAIYQLCSHEPNINDEDKDGCNQWMNGRAGYLYLLRASDYVVERTGDFEGNASSRRLLHSTMEKTIHRMLEVPQPWNWQAGQQLGAAYGTIGSICQIVLSTEAVTVEMQDQLRRILAAQLASGNFPASLPAPAGSFDRRETLVQFCHGAPGFVVSLRSLRPHVPTSMREQIDAAIARTQAHVWARGLLTKMPCLCHGIAGNALALDRPADFVHFQSFMSTAGLVRSGRLMELKRGVDNSSLYTGEAGRAWVWVVADLGLEKTVLGYNDV
ncbi:hypothetical protein PG999_005471 [Apiospora kogelbergensis]|uniref:Lanthionine synthetase C-like protein n=1 Tax=Apiospora kogelbergensis TaxID=1337665 RepID=A0AAW0R2A8_9PEZI